MRRPITGVAVSLAAVLVLAVGSVGASASPERTTQHFAWSNNWQGYTGVSLGNSAVCPVFAGESGYLFSDVNLTDSGHTTVIPIPSEPSLWRFKSIAKVAGELYGPDGTYTVTSGPLREDRIDAWMVRYFEGSGPVTIAGPSGTVSGRATFFDITGDNGNMYFDFTSVTGCHLN